MSDTPWLTIIGLGEDGPAGLSPASQAALDTAEIIMGPPRHLALLPQSPARHVPWPVPFADGLPMLEQFRGQTVVVLASGDPFWYGAGSTIARHLKEGEWRVLPAASTFSLAAAQMGWPLESTQCLGLHAAPFSRMRAHLAPGQRLIILLRDGEAVADLGAYVTDQGFGDSMMCVLERLGGPHQRQTSLRADSVSGTFQHPVCVALRIAGNGPVIPVASGRPDDVFEHDGQITKRPMRAITLSTLAPKPGEHLWDIGAGSGSIALEWLMAHPRMTATAVEMRADRAARIARNAMNLGVADRLTVLEGVAVEQIEALPKPDAIFVGGGLSDALLDQITAQSGARLVANGVTLEAEALLAAWQNRLGGHLMRIDLANMAPLGSKRGWNASYPVVQWNVTL